MEPLIYKKEKLKIEKYNDFLINLREAKRYLKATKQKELINKIDEIAKFAKL